MVKRFFTEEQQKRDLPAAATGNDDELSEDEGEDTLTPVRSSNRSTKRRAASVKAEKKIKKERAYIASLRDEANRGNISGFSGLSRL